MYFYEAVFVINIGCQTLHCANMRIDDVARALGVADKGVCFEQGDVGVGAWRGALAPLNYMYMNRAKRHIIHMRNRKCEFELTGIFSR